MFDEKTLIHLIYLYPHFVREAGENFSPAVIANYVYEVAKAYNHYYHNHVIVDEAAPVITSFRLHLSDITSLVIKESMNLLGISVPERM